MSSLRRLLAQTAMFLALFVGFALGAFAGSGALGGPHSPQAARAVGDPELVDFRSSAASFLGGALPFESESESECEGTDQADGDDDATAGDASAPLSSFALAVRTLPLGSLAAAGRNGARNDAHLRVSASQLWVGARQARGPPILG